MELTAAQPINQSKETAMEKQRADQLKADAMRDGPSEKVGAVSCDTPGCRAQDYYIRGDRRDEMRARRWASNHKKHLEG